MRSRLFQPTVPGEARGTLRLGKVPSSKVWSRERKRSLWHGGYPVCEEFIRARRKCAQDFISRLVNVARIYDLGGAPFLLGMM